MISIISTNTLLTEVTLKASYLLRALWVGTLCVSIASCSDSTSGQDEATGPHIEHLGDFKDHFQLIDTVIPEQPDSAPLILPNAVALGPDSLVVVSDASEGNLKQYDDAWRLLRVMGRKGEGPGEFLAPASPQIDDSGRIHVLDRRLNRITVWSPSGDVVRTVRLPVELPPLGSMGLLPQGDYALASLSVRNTSHVLFKSDSLGTSIDSLLPLASSSPQSGDTMGPWLRAVNGFLLAVRGTQIHAVSVISNTLWTLDFGPAADVTAIELAIPGYIAPFPAPDDVQTPEQGRMWYRQFHSAMQPIVLDDFLVLSYVEGYVGEGDPATLVLGTPDGRWLAVSDAPGILGGGNGVALALHLEQESSGFIRYRIPELW